MPPVPPPVCGCTQTAAEEGRARGKALERLQRSEAKLLTWIKSAMFNPSYTSLVNLPQGVGN